MRRLRFTTLLVVVLAAILEGPRCTDGLVLLDNLKLIRDSRHYWGLWTGTIAAVPNDDTTSLDAAGTNDEKSFRMLLMPTSFFPRNGEWEWEVRAEVVNSIWGSITLVGRENNSTNKGYTIASMGVKGAPMASTLMGSSQDWMSFENDVRDVFHHVNSMEIVVGTTPRKAGSKRGRRRRHLILRRKSKPNNNTSSTEQAGPEVEPMLVCTRPAVLRPLWQWLKRVIKRLARSFHTTP